jgi:tetratricopeptide (TPR) repeat protein
LPQELWALSGTAPDPFISIDETQLLTLLNSGSDRLDRALLGPQIRQIGERAGTTRWSVLSSGASIEELMSKFADSAGLDIRWNHAPQNSDASQTLQIDVIRKRRASLYMPDTTEQQLLAVAAGSVGLAANIDKQHVVNIFNPLDYSSLSKHISSLVPAALSLWQQFLLRFHDDQRVPNAHLALGLLHAGNANTSEAVAEYKLVANRFSKTSLAPFALLYSSKIKAGLRDYAGARQDLKQLVEQYPNTEIAGKAYLFLAEATAKAQMHDEANRVYRKVYYQTLALDARIAAALGAGESSYQTQDYESAAEWLARYITIAKDHENEDLSSAYFLLGKANLALGNTEQAANALHLALNGRLSNEQYAQTVFTLAHAYMQQENFLKALATLENAKLWQFSQPQSIRLSLVKSRIFRLMGLPRKAIAVLGNKAEFIQDPQLKAETRLELSECYIAGGDFELACSELADILLVVEPGPLAHEIAIKLAGLCLKLGNNSQAASVCLQILDMEPAEPVKRKALDILAHVYKQEKRYDSAALAFLGQWEQ